MSPHKQRDWGKYMQEPQTLYDDVLLEDNQVLRHTKVFKKKVLLAEGKGLSQAGSRDQI